MSNAVAAQNQTTQVAMPSELMSFFSNVKPTINIAERVNSLRISGKVWKTDIEGELKQLMTTVEGESIPVPMVRVIILNQNTKRARALFEGVFEEGVNNSPVCWSSDSIHPNGDVTTPKAKSCEQCEMSKKHTKFDDSNPDKVIEYVPCKFNKRIAVADAKNPSGPVLRLQLAITSLWEPKESAKLKEAQGWYAFDSYCKMLANKNITHIAACRTIMKFDPDSNSPKVLFKFDGFIDAASASVIVPRIESEEVAKALGLNKKVTDSIGHIEPISTVVNNVVIQQAVQEPESFVEQEQVAEIEQAAPAPKVEKPKAVPKEPKKPVQVVEEDISSDLLSLAWD